MTKRTRLPLILITVLLLIAIFTATFASVLSMASGGDLGESPLINLFKGELNIDSTQFYDGTVIQRLPESVKDTDELSLIIQIGGESLLDIYDNAYTEMSFSDFYTTHEAISVRRNLALEAEEFCTLLCENGIDYALGDSYTTLFRGFEIVIKAGDFLSVCKALGDDVNVIVSEVYETEETELVENNVNAFETGIFDTTGFEYDGTGVVVAVLDTGTDYYHSAFSMENFTADESEWGLTFEDIQAIVNDTVAAGFQAGLTASDVYISGKLPYGFDYADKDSDVFPINSHHGTHVAGIIAGKDDTITGVAPNAQIVTMKIFSDTEQSARASWIISALEDCVILGVDVINMSIGTSCGFSRETDKEAMSGVYDRVRESGIAMVVAASNSFNSTYASEKNGNLGLTSNPDSATVGSPSTYDGALSVASIEGAKTSYLLFGDNIIYFEESTDRVSEEKNFVEELLGDSNETREFEYVVIPGSGIEADYAGLDLTGKIALIRRGTTTFEEKANAAQAMGAAAAIIYNNVSGDIKMNVGEATIPVCSISQTDGEMLAATKTGKIKIGKSQAAGPFMSDFSSWGPAPDLSIKPEITAHGGSILSAVPGQEYDRISGTSMATPNISGVTALLRQYVMENFPESVTKDPATVTAVVNRLMMSTADIILNKNNAPYSVRKQGAGLANLVAASTTGAYILTYDRLDGSLMDKSKIELGDDPTRTGVYTLKFTIDNFGKTAVSYDISAEVLTEGVSDVKTNQGETTVTETAKRLGATVTVTSVNGTAHTGSSVTVAAGEKAHVVVTVTLTDEDKKYLDDNFENGMYVEGFVVLDAQDGTPVDLSVPYLAFYGDWTEAPIFDLDYFETNKDELDDSIDLLDKTLPDAYASRPVGGISDDYVSYLGSFYYEQKPGTNMISANRNYISLTNSETGINSLRFVWMGMLRNADYIKIVITDDATGEVVYETVDNDIRKSYGEGGAIRPANVDVEFSAIENNLKNNTKYTCTLTGYLDYERDGATTNDNNTFSFPITIDFEAPTLTGCEFYTEYDRSAKKNRLYAKLAIYDNHYSMAMLPGYVAYDSSALQYSFMPFDRYVTQIYSEENSTSYVIYELTDLIDDIKEGSYNKNTFAVSLYDYALNLATYEIALPDNYTDLYFEEMDITLSPNQTYSLNPIVYPNTEWGELVDYRVENSSVAAVVNNKLVALSSGATRIRCRVTLDSGVTKDVYLNLTVLKQGDAGYKRYDPPVTEKFTLSGFYVNKAYYFLSSSDRDIGTTGDERKFVGTSYDLKMFPSESITVRYDLDAYFPNKTTVVFETSNPNIVTVAADGTVTAVAEGYASITAKVLLDGKSTFYSQTISIEVKEPYVTSGAALSNYYGLGGTVEIPSTLNVTSIGQYAFSNFDYVPKESGDEISEEAPELTKITYIGDDTIVEVIIPEGVEEIGPYAFAGLTALRAVELPSTLKKIDVGAFYGCTSLSVVSGLGNVKFINQSAFESTAINGNLTFTSTVAIGDRAFANCPNITGIILSENTQSVGAYAFMNNTDLTSLTVASERIKLGKYAFSGNVKLGTVSLNAAVIPTGAFNDCTQLALVELGKDVAVIGEYAFRNTAVAAFVVNSGNTTFKAVSGAQYLTSADGKTLLLAAPAIKTLNVTDTSITAIADAAFSGNKNLTSVSIPSVTSVGKFAFSECNNLETAVLGQLTYVGDYAFAKTSLRAMPSIKTDSIGSYAFAGTLLTAVNIPDGITVGEGAFMECKLLNTVSVGENVTLGDYAFAYNTSLTDWSSAYYTDYNGDRVFYYVYNSPLTSLEVGDNCKIGDYAFFGASKLVAFSLGKDAEIGDKAFYNATNLKQVTGDGLASVKSIGNEAFSGDVLYCFYDQDMQANPAFDAEGSYVYSYNSARFELIELTNLSYLGENAFAHCQNLVAVTLGENMTSVSDGAFFGCIELESINLDRLETIGAHAFESTALTSVNLTSATEVGDYAFLEADKLMSVTFSAAIERVGEGAFAYCPLLANVSGMENVKVIGDYAFAYTALTSADLTSCEELGTHAFMKEKDKRVSFNLTLGTKLKEIGDGPFVYCDLLAFTRTVTETFNGVEYKNTINTFDLGDKVRIINGSIYEVVPNGLELVYYFNDGKVTTVADNTVRIGAYAFCGSNVVNVVLPYTVESIGHKAFFDCEKLAIVNFSSYYAPTLEEEYDAYYFQSSENLPTPPEYDTALGGTGLGIIDYFMWNVGGDQTNIFYGANFKNYVGKVDNKIIMISPVNGVHYDSFIFSQYFDTFFEGANAADDNTLSAIDAINRLPATVTLNDKAAVELARALYNKVSSNEQKALVTNYQKLTDAERMISDLEYLANQGTPAPEPDDTTEPEGMPWWGVLLIVLGSLIGLCGLLVGLAFIFRELAKRGKVEALREKFTEEQLKNPILAFLFPDCIVKPENETAGDAEAVEPEAEPTADDGEPATEENATDGKEAKADGETDNSGEKSEEDTDI